MGTKVNSNYEDLITFTRASAGHALRPVSYGTELVTNGDFSSTDLSDYTTQDCTIAVVSGEIEVTYTASTQRVIQRLSGLKVGSLYAVSYEIYSNSATSNVSFFVSSSEFGSGDIASNVTALTSTKTTHTLLFTAESTQDYIQLFSLLNASQSYFADNISVKEVLFDQPDGTLTLFEHPDNIPRVEYDADGNRLGLLVEESRTNLITYSEEFENSAWTQGRLTVTSERIEGPDKVSDSGRKLEGTSDIGSHRLYSPVFNVTSGTTYTATVYMKKGEDDSPRLALTDNTESGTLFLGANSTFDLTNGTADADGSIEDVGNGWYRCTLTGTAQSTASARLFIYLNDRNSVAFDGQGLYVYGAQLEAGSFPTSYIKTTGATATRSADVASIPVSDFGYNQSAGSLFVRATYINTPTGILGRYLELNGPNAVTDRILIYVDSDGDNFQQIRTGGVDQSTFTYSNDLNVDSKVATRFKKNSTIFSVNGTNSSEDTSVTLPDNIETLDIGRCSSDVNAVGQVYIHSIKYYPRALTAAQLQDLTS